MGNQLLIGHTPYSFLYLIKNGLYWQSSFFHPSILVMTGINYLSDQFYWQLIPTLLFGLGSVFLFYNLLRKSKLEIELQLAVAALLILSPIFIFTFATLNHYSALIFLILLGFNFLITKKCKYLALPVFLIIPFFDVFTTFFVLILLLMYLFISKEKFVYYIFGSFLLLTIILQFVYPQIFYLQPIFLERNISFEFFSDLGGFLGFGFFPLLLSFLGLIITWKQKKINYLIYLLIVFLIASFFILGDYVNIYLNFFLVLLAGQGFIWLWKRSWKFDFLKKISVLILIFGIVFSTVSYVNRLSVEPLNPSIEESMIWLKDRTSPGGFVLSHPEKSFWIEAIAERKPFLDIYGDDYQQRLETAELIFYSRDWKLTTQLLEENKIKYIWIDSEMLNGQVWNEEEEGLLFLLRDPRYRRIYRQEGIEIWRFE
ncbi:hypothetical protein ACFLZB_01775 [Nanoarchaeota archaeon]